MHHTTDFTRATAVVFALSALTAASAGAQTLSLNEAIALGLRNNPTVANAALQVEKTEQDVAIARTRRLPSLKIEMQGSQLLRPIDVTFSRGAFGEFAGIGPIPATDTAITTPVQMNFLISAEAQQPLTQLIKLNLNVRLNEATRDYDKETARDARLGLVGRDPAALLRDRADARLARSQSASADPPPGTGSRRRPARDAAGGAEGSRKGNHSKKRYSTPASSGCGRC